MDVRLMNGDCLELMKDIPDGSVDMILCDLPYGTTQNKWDTVIPFEPLWEQYNRLIKDDGAIVLFGSEPFSSALRMSNAKEYKYDWVWLKHQCTNFLNAKHQPLRNTENISVFCKEKSRYYPIMVHGREQLKSTGGASSCYGAFRSNPHFSESYYPKQTIDMPQIRVKDGHPTQKPVALLEYLIRTYTLEGETVLDNCMGSGSTGVACVNTDRGFIGIELDPDYFAIAEKRIDEAVEERKQMLF